MEAVRRGQSEADGRRCVVVNTEGIVLGVIDRDDLEAAPDDASAADVMEFGPSTFRPAVETSELAHYMDHNGIDLALITTSAGRLLGGVSLDDLPRP